MARNCKFVFSKDFVGRNCDIYVIILHCARTSVSDYIIIYLDLNNNNNDYGIYKDNLFKVFKYSYEVTELEICNQISDCKFCP